MLYMTMKVSRVGLLEIFLIQLLIPELLAEKSHHCPHPADSFALGQKDLLYVSNTDVNFISRIDIKSGSVTRRFVGDDLNGDRHGMAIGPRGDLFVCSAEGILRYDGRTGARLSMAYKVARPLYLAFAPENRYLFVTQDLSSSLLVFDVVAGACMGVIETGKDAQPWGVCIGPDARLYVWDSKHRALVRSTTSYLAEVAAVQAGQIAFPWAAKGTSGTRFEVLTRADVDHAALVLLPAADVDGDPHPPRMALFAVAARTTPEQKRKFGAAEGDDEAPPAAHVVLHINVMRGTVDDVSWALDPTSTHNALVPAPLRVALLHCVFANDDDDDPDRRESAQGIYFAYIAAAAIVIVLGVCCFYQACRHFELEDSRWRFLTRDVTDYSLLGRRGSSGSETAPFHYGTLSKPKDMPSRADDAAHHDGWIEGMETPPHLCCAITHQVMHEPVVGADGHTYERKAIELWYREHATSPLTGKPVRSKALFPNFNVQSQIRDFEETRARLIADLRRREADAAAATLDCGK